MQYSWETTRGLLEYLSKRNQHNSVEGQSPVHCNSAGSDFLILRREGVGTSKSWFSPDKVTMKRYMPFDLPKTRGLDVDNRGFFSGDWLSWSFSVSA